jgi:hypothetical protein
MADFSPRLLARSDHCPGIALVSDHKQVCLRPQTSVANRKMGVGTGVGLFETAWLIY